MEETQQLWEAAPSQREAATGLPTPQDMRQKELVTDRLGALRPRHSRQPTWKGTATLSRRDSTETILEAPPVFVAMGFATDNVVKATMRLCRLLDALQEPGSWSLDCERQLRDGLFLVPAEVALPGQEGLRLTQMTRAVLRARAELLVKRFRQVGQGIQNHEIVPTRLGVVQKLFHQDRAQLHHHTLPQRLAWAELAMMARCLGLSLDSAMVWEGSAQPLFPGGIHSQAIPVSSAYMVDAILRLKSVIMSALDQVTAQHRPEAPQEDPGRASRAFKVVLGNRGGIQNGEKKSCPPSWLLVKQGGGASVLPAEATLDVYVRAGGGGRSTCFYGGSICLDRFLSLPAHPGTLRKPTTMEQRSHDYIPWHGYSSLADIQNLLAAVIVALPNGRRPTNLASIRLGQWLQLPALERGATS
ncbi:hypothetical protein E3E12_02580 [Formicincola oecophyllae]|uniref:Uncharacterized protein n=1 Tax=Formicincola oecophyllae TaxID=2558361 RepID=A0A4Y6UA72_9PROT|nr:hypothetical protein [Formicincola oecophyllae]QDH13271.2 hypothetical protein E3E12_02580 [Formicincola oecophyllae]